MRTEDRYMTVEEVAQYLGFEKQTIYNKVHNNEIPFHKIGIKAVRFKKGEIDGWLKLQQDKEGSYLKKDEKYYMVFNNPCLPSQMNTEDEFLKDCKKETAAFWHYQSSKANLNYNDRLEFGEDDIKNAKKILKMGLIYPHLLKNNTPVYEWIDSGALTNYLTILKLFKGTLIIDFLPKLKKKFIENVNEVFFFSIPDVFENVDEAKIGFKTEAVVYDLLNEFCSILVYLACEKKDPKSRFLPYANRYFDKETFFTLYLGGFCYFDKNPFSSEPEGFVVKDKSITQLTSDQIILGLKHRFFLKEDVIKEIHELEKKLKALKSIIKGDGHGKKDKKF